MEMLIRHSCTNSATSPDCEKNTLEHRCQVLGVASRRCGTFMLGGTAQVSHIDVTVALSVSVAAFGLIVFGCHIDFFQTRCLITLAQRVALEKGTRVFFRLS